MDKNKIYNYCLTLRSSDEPLGWVEIHKRAIKEKVITKYVTLPELKAAFREIAGIIASGDTAPATGGYDSNVEDFFKFIGKTGDAFPKREKTTLGKRQTTDVITDVHVPYHSKKHLEKFMSARAGKSDRLVIGGDFLNGTQLSTHPKMVVENFKRECEEGRMMLEWFASEFPEVIIMDDNHIHSRWMRYISAVMTPDLHFLTVHPYDYITSGLKNVVRAKDASDLLFAEEWGWIYVMGDAIISHAEISSAVDMRPARKVDEFINKWRPILKFPEPRFILQAHNHKLGIAYDVDKAVAMSGCMVGLEGLTYSMGAKAVGAPPVHGYTTIVQEDGVTDLGETRIVKLPFEV